MLIVILAGTAIRGGLLSRGQYLFPDEARYDRSLDFWDAFFELQPARAVTVLFKAKGRPGAVVTYLPVSLVQWSANRIFDLQRVQTSWLPALFTVALAALNTILFHRLSRRLFACEAMCVLGTILYGLCAPGLYYVQFLLPYIAAQTWLLAALLVSARHRGRCGKRIDIPLMLSGLLFGMAFATYPGIYDHALVLLAVAWLLLGRCTLRAAAQLLWIPLGTSLILIGFQLLSLLGWGPTYFESLRELSGLINQGDFAEVWKFPALFLWSADALLCILLAIGLVGAFHRLFGLRHSLVGRVACSSRLQPGFSFAPPASHLAVLLAPLALWYAWHVVEGLRHSQVLYGRLVFQIMPVLCLIAGAGLAHLLGRSLATPLRWALCSLLMSVWAVINIWPFFRTVTPAKFEHQWQAANPDSTVVAYVTSIVGPRATALEQGQPHTSPSIPIVFANTQPLYPVKGFHQPDDLHILHRGWHPLNIPALQFEGWNPHERSILRSHTLWMMALPPHLTMTPPKPGCTAGPATRPHSNELNTTTFLPVPIDLFTPFMKKAGENPPTG